jgi:chromate transporter
VPPIFGAIFLLMASAPTLAHLFTIFFRIGLTSFGMTMLESLQRSALRHNLLSEEELREGLALVQLYPGPILFDLVTFIGYRRRGTLGACAAALGFILPATVFMLAVAWIYEHYGALPTVQTLSSGLGALVVGIMLQVVADFGQKSLRSLFDGLVAITALGAALFHVSAVYVIVAALIVGALIKRVHASTSHPPVPIRWSRLATPLLISALVVSAGIVFMLHATLMGTLALVFLKIGATAFGNAATILPVMQEAVVRTHHWLSPSDFNIAVALGNLTPGPILNSATFVGYRVAGTLGALAATVAIFAPSFAMTLVFTELFDHIRHWQVIQNAIRCVMSSFVGLLVATVISMAAPLSGQPASIMLATAAFFALRFFRIGLGWIFLIGLGGWYAWVWLAPALSV